MAGVNEDEGKRSSLRRGGDHESGASKVGAHLLTCRQAIAAEAPGAAAAPSHEHTLAQPRRRRWRWSWCTRPVFCDDIAPGIHGLKLARRYCLLHCARSLAPFLPAQVHACNSTTPGPTCQLARPATTITFTAACVAITRSASALHWDSIVSHHLRGLRLDLWRSRVLNCK